MTIQLVYVVIVVELKHARTLHQPLLPNVTCIDALICIQDGSLCSLDLLSMANLVNYFGKSPSIDNITLFPILLVKGTTKVQYATV
jgi:hypothetical protein